MCVCVRREMEGESTWYLSQKWDCLRPWEKNKGDEVHVAKQNGQLKSAISQMDLLNMVEQKLLSMIRLSFLSVPPPNLAGCFHYRAKLSPLGDKL